MLHLTWCNKVQARLRLLTFVTMEFVTGGCKLINGCDIGCSRFQKDEFDENLCRYCHYDISAHEILGVIQDSKAVLLGAGPTMAVVPLPLPLKETAVEERK